MTTLLIVFGSTRPSRGGMPVARWFENLARQQAHFTVDFADLAAVNLPLLDEPEHPVKQAYVHDHTKAWSQQVAAANALVFVTPEYDYFPPAALVNAIQYLSKEWSGKPAGIVSYGGLSGGLRSTQALRLLLSGVGLFALQPSVSLPFYNQLINEQGIFAATDAMNKSAHGLLDELARMSAKLTP